MFINNFSASKLSTYEECPLKYKLRYVDRLDPVFNDNSNTDALHYGSFVHKVFEDGVEAETMEDLMEIANKERDNYDFPKSKFQNFKDMCKNFLKLNATLNEVGEAEQRFKFQFGDPEKDMNVNGIIDRIIKSESGKYLVIDYKTSKRPISQMDLFRDDDMKMYAYAVTQLYSVSVKDVTLAHFYPHLDKLVTVRFCAADIASFLKKVQERMWKIRKMKKDDFSACHNKFCNWCGYKGVCPKFNDQMLIEQRMQAFLDTKGDKG